MTENLRLILKLIALLLLGFAGFYGLTRWAAPAQGTAAILVGLLLTSFGAAFAKFAMEWLVLPLGLLQMLVRAFGGGKPVVVNRRGHDPLDVLGRVVFVAVFATLAGLAGVGMGLFAGGLGFFSAGLAFAAFGAVLAMLVPAELMWAAEGGDAGVGLSAAQRAEADSARRAGDPAGRFTDGVVRDVRENLFEDDTRSR